MSRIIKNKQVMVGSPIKVNCENIDILTKNNASGHMSDVIEEVQNPEFINKIEHDNENKTSSDIDEITEKDREDAIKEIQKLCEDMIDKARFEAERIISEANDSAERIVEGALFKAEELAKTVESDAYNAGYEKGLEKAKSEYEGLLKDAQNIKNKAAQQMEEIFEAAEKEIVKIILEVSKKVIVDELLMDEYKMLSVVRDALKKCSDRTKLTVRVSSYDYDIVNENIEDIVSNIEDIGSIEIKKDIGLKKGSVIVETPFGIIDAGIETKLKKIEEEFLKICCKENNSFKTCEGIKR